MLHKKRGMLGLLVGGLLLAVAGAAFWLLWLPHPNDANRDQLLRWLMARDLSEEPLELRLALIHRLEEEYGDGVDWDGLGKRLSATEQQRVWENVRLLLRPWVMEKVDVLDQLPPPERAEYLGQFLDTVEAWQGAGSYQQASDASAAGQGDLRDVLRSEMRQWKQEADAEQRRKIDIFLEKAELLWKLRKLEQFSNSLPSRGKSTQQ